MDDTDEEDQNLYLMNSGVASYADPKDGVLEEEKKSQLDRLIQKA